MRVVIDASVAVKWVIPDPGVEDGVEAALGLLRSIREGQVMPVQPPHWLAEVAAVVTRLRPQVAEEALDLLDAMELPVASDLEVMKRASRIAHDLNHHLFDTLYHAVALERDATLISADGTYCRKAAPPWDVWSSWTPGQVRQADEFVLSGLAGGELQGFTELQPDP